MPVLGSLCVSMEDSGADLPREGACGWFGDPSNPFYCLHPRSQGHSDNPQVKEGSQGLIRTGPSQGAGNPRSRAISFIRLFCSEFTKRSPPLRFHPFPHCYQKWGRGCPLLPEAEGASDQSPGVPPAEGRLQCQAGGPT